MAVKEYPWQDGTYLCHWDGKVIGTCIITGSNGILNGVLTTKEDENTVDLNLGEFESVDKRGLKASGQEKYTVEVIMTVLKGWKFISCVSEDGKTFYLESGDTWDFMDEDALKKMEDMLDPVDNYSHHYELQPDNQGKLLWITGGTGMGKTTTSELLREKHGFVFYEGDCFLAMANPYAGNSPAGQSYFGTKRLKDVPDERHKKIHDLIEGYKKLMAKEDVDITPFTSFYDDMCDDIIKEKKKIGGNWVVPQAVYQREARDFIRKKLGDQCVFILLDMPKEMQIKRLALRAVGSSGEITEEVMEKYSKLFDEMGGTNGYERMEDDEPNSIPIAVDESMDPDCVAKLILERLKNIWIPINYYCNQKLHPLQYK